MCQQSAACRWQGQRRNRAGGIHNGSRLLVLPDNTLLMTTGDAGDGGQSSQSDNSDNGKVLRFNLDGSVPSNNPDPTSYVTWEYCRGYADAVLSDS